jgi:peptidoglycan/LPS O-acetylase OafA/YrhL
MKDHFGISSAGQIPVLDGLRGLSIIAVIGFHGEWAGFSGGGRGVDLFYVISGYLIAWLLLKEKSKYGSVSLKLFYYRRMLRILPAFYVFLAGYWIMCQFIFADFKKELGQSLVIAGTYSTNIMIGWFNYDVLLAHTWSLSMEEQFYLIFPAVIAFTSRTKAIIIACSVIICLPFWRFIIYMMSDSNISVYRFAYSPDTRMDTIIIGCLIALIMVDANANKAAKKWFSHASVFVAGIIIIAGAIILSEQSKFFMSTIGYTLIAAGVSVILLFALSNPDHSVNRFIATKPLQIIGRLSYALYLWHPASLGIANKVAYHTDIHWQGIVQVVAYVGIAFTCAIASYFLVERPFLHLKDRYTIVRAGA